LLKSFKESNMRSANLRVTALAWAVTLFAASATCGQPYPNKPIRIVTSVPGGSDDFASRLVAQGITGPLGQPVVIDNRGGTLRFEIVAKAVPDGYTLLVASSPFYIEPLLRKTEYDAIKDFAAVVMIDRAPNLLVVHPSLAANSVKDLIALGKANPGALNYGSGSTGSSTHLAGELFKSMAGVNIVRIPYKSGGTAVTDLVGGHVQLMFATPASAAPHVKSGKLRALGVTSAEPSALLPGVPTIASSLPGYEIIGLDAVYAPAKTPATAITLLNREIVRYLKTNEAREKFLAIGSEAVGSSPEQLAAAVKADIARLGKVIKDAGITAD
jgi:tripartite-type tricarboxylate transporter receptor subunit TctC